MSDSYLYEDVPVLRNKLDIRDERTLDLIEAEQSRANMMLLYERGFEDFSPNGLREIHRFLFEDVYEWAGSIELSISKNGKDCWADAASGTATTKIFLGTWIQNYFISRFSTSPTNGPRSLSPTGSHTAAHTPKHGPSGRGRYHYPRRALRAAETPDGRLPKGLICHFLRLGSLH